MRMATLWLLLAIPAYGQMPAPPPAPPAPAPAPPMPGPSGPTIAGERIVDQYKLVRLSIGGQLPEGGWPVWDVLPAPAAGATYRPADAQADLSTADTMELDDGQQFVFTAPPGRYTVRLSVFSIDKDKKRHKVAYSTIVEIKGTPPPPGPGPGPGPGPAPPPDALTAEFRALYQQDPDPQDLAVVATIFRLAGQENGGLADDPAVATNYQLYQKLAGAQGGAIMKITHFKALRERLAAYLNDALGTKVAQPLTPELRKKAKVEFNRLAGVLDQVGK